MGHIDRYSSVGKPTNRRSPGTGSQRSPRKVRAKSAGWLAGGVLVFVVAACGSSGGGGPAPGGSGGSGAAPPAAAGSGNLAGAHQMGAAGASVGGVSGQPGSVGGIGGNGGGGGGRTGVGGTAGTSSASAGAMSAAGSTSAAGSGAGHAGGTASGGSSGTGTCQKGQIKPAEVVIMGESFYAIDPQYIQKRIQDDARKAGSLGASDSYRNVAVSGQNMNYIATTEWTAATQGGASVKFVIMDGGGIDCLTGGSTCSTCSSTFATLLGKMAAAGVQDVMYTRYPEPGAPPGSNASLKACLDSTMPGMQTTCEGSTSPRCHWVDLRPVFVAGDTTDGLHPTESGGEHVGDLIWSEMVKDCLAQ